MDFIRGINNLQSCYRGGCALTIGNFDGFHRGHQTLIAKLQVESRYHGLPLIVMIFEPQPQEYFANKNMPVRLTTLRDKVKYLAAAGVDAVVCITFDKQFASLSAKDFVTDFLVQRLSVRFIGVGDDFRFGAHRQGDYAFLQQVGKKAGFKVIKTITYAEDGQRVSSTAIREALSQDRLVEAEMLLGHPYCLSGRVMHGDALGRMIGFPTANVSLKGLLVPVTGVYLVKVYGITDQPLPGIANIGTRPTIYGLHQQLEVHLLDITMNLYSYHIEVVILAKMRNEKQFASLNDLKHQIIDDVVNARNYFGLAMSNNV